MTQNDKTSLRVKYREVRKRIKTRTEKEQAICDSFLKSCFYSDSERVFVYAAVGSEVNIDCIFEKALSDGKKVALPVCTDKDGNMEFYYVDSLAFVKSGMYGIREPEKDKCHKAVSDEKTVCLVPGLCFSKKGGRLGYGKGYYDRFLSDFKGTAIGICFEECIEENLNIDAYDKTVNYLITDKNIYTFKEYEEV